MNQKLVPTIIPSQFSSNLHNTSAEGHNECTKDYCEWFEKKGSFAKNYRVISQIPGSEILLEAYIKFGIRDCNHTVVMTV